MKILYITPGCFDKGGISRYSRYQISALRELYGINNVKVISFLGPDEDSFETMFDVTWHGCNKGLIDRIKLVFVALYYTLSFLPKVIQVAHINYSSLAKVLALIAKSKTILNVYGLEVWTNLKKHSAWGLSNADYVISDCQATKDYIVNNGLRRNGHDIEVIWDCVDTNLFCPVNDFPTSLIDKYRLPDRNEYFIITSLGRMSKDAAYKGYDRLIKVFSQISLMHKNTFLLMIGRGDLIDSLKQLAVSHHVEDRVIFTGSVSEEELPKLLSYGHLFSLVTNSGDGMGEGLPLTPLEAMACGLPIIVGNKDGSREAIFNQKNGYSIDPLDLDNHSKIINIIVGDIHKYQELSNEALVIVNKYFSYNSFKQKLESFYLGIR